MTLFSLYLSPNFRTGGQKRYLEALNGLGALGHQVFLFHRKEIELPIERVTGIPLDMPSGGYSVDKSFASALGKYLKSNPSLPAPDMLFQFGESAVSSLQVLKAACKVPLLIALRNNWIEANRLARQFEKKSQKRRLKGWALGLRDRLREKQVAKLADTIVFQSAWDRDAFHKRQGEGPRLSIIPNSIRVGWFDPDFRHTNRSEKLKKIVFIGSEDPRKGMNLLLKAFSETRQTLPELELHLYGHFHENLQARVEEKGWAAGVFLHGYIPSALPSLKEADLFIIPSLYDSFPNTLLEALFVGTPCCGTRVAGIEVMLKDKELLFEPGDAAQIADLIQKFTHPEFYRNKAEYCRSRISEFDFDWIDAWNQELNQLIH